jgi:hypothetical protein
MRTASALVGLLLLAGAMGAQAEPAKPAIAKLQSDGTAGYARIVLTFDDMPGVSTRMSNGIVVINFTQPVSLPLDRLVSTLPDYVAAARIDPDGKAIRLALARRVRLNTMEAGERYFVDLLPDSWRQAPPSLPQDVLDELNAKAREAERLKREAQARIARAKPKPIEVTAARQPTFTRLSFDLGDPVPVRLERSGNTIVVTFDAALQADINTLKAELPPRLESIDAVAKDARLTVSFNVAEGTDIRAFWDSGAYVIDVAGGKGGEAAAVSTALPKDLADALASTTAPGQGVTVLEASQHGAVQTALPAPVPSAPETVPAHEPRAPPPSQPAVSAKPEPAAPATQASPPAPAPPPPARAAAPAPAPTPESPAIPATDPVRPILTRLGETLRIGFPFDRRTPAAVYRRGDSLWLVFDTPRQIDADAIAADAADLVSSARATASEGGIVLRLKLRKTPLTTMSPDGTGWIVTIGDQILSGAAPVPLRRIVKPDGRTAVQASLDGVGQAHRIADTDVGDTVIVVTASAPGRAFLKSQEFVEFRTLPTAHGLAFVPNSDDLVISVGLDDVTVSRDGGLTISAGTGPSAPMTADESAPPLVDTAVWNREIEAPFQARERELFQAAANSSDRDRLPARKTLARFYLAKNFIAEAAAVLDVARAADKNAGQDPEFALLLAASRALQGRGEETNQILEDFGLLASADGALWQSVAEAANHHFAAARDAFLKGAGAINRYPAALQARFRMAAFEAALEGGEISEASVQKEALDELKVDVADPGKRALLDARLAEAEDRKPEALEAYRALAAGPYAISGAEARLRAVTLRKALGQADDKSTIDELETLAATWRGDEVEARTLSTLAEENLRQGEDRKAFSNMEVALEHFPRSETTRALQDRMQERFVALFLRGEADRMKPIDALSLFYDHRELTPADRRGDDMIRHLADRLVEVDLLDQAADLLQHQIDNRLTGAGRAQVAAKLAMIDLMNRKPSQALQALVATRQAELPRELVTARLLIEARALSESARPDLALEILEHVEAPEVGALRADVLWQARRWPEAGAALEAELGDCWQAEAPLTDAQRAAALRAAISYSLAEDKLSLDRLRTKFADKMANSVDAASFETVTAPIEARGARFGDIARQIASIDTLDAFLASYRKRFADMPLPGAPSAANERSGAPAPAAAGAG